MASARCDPPLTLEVGALPHAEVPQLYELWTWEGDETVLPFKWEKGLEDSGGCAARESRGLQPWNDSGFDRESIFFITHRSETCGVAAVLPNNESRSDAVVVALGVRPQDRRHGIGRCLLRLCAHRAAELGHCSLHCAVDPEQEMDACRLLAAEGFSSL